MTDADVRAPKVEVRFNLLDFQRAVYLAEKTQRERSKERSEAASQEARQ